jgi:hypothetical protein
VHRYRSYVGVVACLALATGACDARSPVAPVSRSVTAPPVPMGIIRDGEGTPIAGATVEFWPPGISQLVTNDAGQFPLPSGYVETIQASKTGYEASWDFFKSDLKLHAILRIAAGQSARVTIRPDDSLGGIGQLRRVRRIRVFSNGDRIVHIAVMRTTTVRWTITLTVCPVRAAAGGRALRIHRRSLSTVDANVGSSSKWTRSRRQAGRSPS